MEEEPAAGPGRGKTVLRNVGLAIAAQAVLLGALVVLFNEPTSSAATLILLPSGTLLLPDAMDNDSRTLQLEAVLALPAGSHLPLDDVQVLLAAPGSLLAEDGNLVAPWCQATREGTPRVEVVSVAGAQPIVAPFTAAAPTLVQGPDGPAYGAPRALDFSLHDTGDGPGVGLGYGAATSGADTVVLRLQVHGCLADASEPTAVLIQLLVGAPDVHVRSLPGLAYVEATPAPPA